MADREYCIYTCFIAKILSRKCNTEVFHNTIALVNQYNSFVPEKIRYNGTVYQVTAAKCINVRSTWQSAMDKFKLLLANSQL